MYSVTTVIFLIEADQKLLMFSKILHVSSRCHT